MAGLKRFFDFSVSVLALTALWPLFVLLAALVKLTSPGPAFFRQERVGLHGKPFRIMKFRSMRVDQDPNAPLVTAGGDQRVTLVGRFLRETKLDELPQLINVARGEMSFVGPRPEVPRYVAHYSDEDRRLVLSVRPGITDLASIEFRDEESILASYSDREGAYVTEVLPRKLVYYRAYAAKNSFWSDVGIILKTLAAIVR